MTMATVLPYRPSRAEAIERLDALSRVLDAAVRIPGTRVTVGADALLNIVPGVGVAVAKALSAYLILEARRHGAPPAMLWRMAARVGIDLALGAIPVVGWFGDALYRANLKNIADLRRHLLAADAAAPAARPHRES